jgi:hypothetical protein
MTIRALIFLAFAALVAAPAALADGGPMYAMQGGQGIAAPNGADHYVAVSTSTGDTTLLSLAKDGSVWSWGQLAGSFGIPMVTYQDPGGLSRDGRTLFLQSMTYGGASNTSFDVVDTRSLAVKDYLVLKGSFAFDALSPNGKRLYLTQHLDASNPSRYVVRAYDLAHHTLLPGRIADRTQRSWVMQGDAMARTVSLGGRWVYTLYANPGGYPFIHALDTVRGVAHCVGLPWRSLADQSGLGNIVLTLHGSRLAVHWRSGRPWLNVDTRTWRVTPAVRGGFPWLWLTPLAVVLLFVPMELLRRRRRSTAVTVEGGSDDSPARLRTRVPLPARVDAHGLRHLPGPGRDAGRPGRALARRSAALRGGEGRLPYAPGGDPAR